MANFESVNTLQNFIDSNFSNFELQKKIEKTFLIFLKQNYLHYFNLKRKNHNTETHQYLTLLKQIQIKHLSKDFLCYLDEQERASSSYIYDPAYRHELNNDNLLDIFVQLKAYYFSYNKFKFFKKIGVDFYYSPSKNIQLQELNYVTKYDSTIEKMIKYATDEEIDEIIKYQPKFFPNLFQEYEAHNKKYECKFDKLIPDSKKTNLVLSVRNPLLLEEFLKHGIDFKTYSDEGNRNILYDTCSKSPSLPFVKYLLDNGVNKNQCTKAGYTTKMMLEQMLEDKIFFDMSSKHEELYKEILMLL